MPIENSGTHMTGAGQQQELPAWLESLRAHERPVASSLSNQQPFSMDELVDENFMPRWMSQDHPRITESEGSDAFPALSATAQPGLSPERQTFPASGLEASSLIDEQSLPSWMRGASEAGQLPAGQAFSAHDLVDQQALPPWIKELGQGAQSQPPSSQMGPYSLDIQPPVTPPSIASVSPIQQTPVPPRHELPPGTGFSAHSLIDQQSLPDWMANTQGTAFQQPPQAFASGQGFKAGELIDQGSVPNWMQRQEQSDSPSAMGMPVHGSGQMMGMGQEAASAEGMPASMLLDMNSMPTWMRAEEQGTQHSGSGMAAGSLIDVNSLPPWLRDADKPQENKGVQNPPASNPGPASQVREGMRVPSRPRSAAGPQEQSEAAANVFASMLGVAASTPVIPGQNPPQTSNLGVTQGQPFQTSQPQSSSPAIPGWQTAQPQTSVPNVQPQTWQMAGSSSQQVGYSPVPPPYSSGGQAGSAPNAQSPSLYTGLPDMERARAGIRPGAEYSNNGEARPTDAKKKGFFDAIRDFFFK